VAEREQGSSGLASALGLERRRKKLFAVDVSQTLPSQRCVHHFSLFSLHHHVPTISILFAMVSIFFCLRRRSICVFGFIVFLMAIL
jgi:hypothetical protein